MIMEYLQANNFKEKQQENIISCFEHEYVANGTTFMDVYIHVDGVTKVDAFSLLMFQEVDAFVLDTPL